MSPLISVVIPTRERCHTLRSTLQTCVDQDYDNCEIIVSDNFSQDQTRAVVEAFRDTRVRYVNTGSRLSMSHNWEFGLSHVRGEYVTFIGDDDGFLPGALSALARIILQTKTAAISWSFGSYFWPNCVHEPSRNLLFVPNSRGLEVRSAPEMLHEVLAFRRGYTELPYLYKGLIRLDMINRVKEMSDGKFFHSMIPDVYSAVALSLVVGNYHYSHLPYSLNGTSASSNGAAQLDPTLNAAQAFLSESNIPFHGDLVLAPATAILIAETFFQVRDRTRLPHNHSIDVLRMLESAMREAVTAPGERYAQVRDAVRAIGMKHGLSGSRLDALFATHPHKPRKTLIGLIEGFNVKNRIQVINCAKFGATNVQQAANLCAAVVGAKELGFMRNPAAVARTTLTLGKGLLNRKLDDWRRRN